jgi:sarcosine oxidase subunit delta
MGEAAAHPSSDDGLADALYARANPKGVAEETWWHRFGCRRWLRLRRDTASNAFVP